MCIVCVFVYVCVCVCMCVCVLIEPTFTAKGEDLSQFHQNFTRIFCADFLLPKNYKAKM